MVPDGTEIIKSHQYEGYCYKRVFVSKRVTEIQSNAFRNCRSLKEVAFEAGSALKKIGDYTFCGTQLKSIQLPSGLEAIGICCFCNSGLEEIILPASVKNIESCAFYKCEKLKNV